MMEDSCDFKETVCLAIYAPLHVLFRSWYIVLTPHQYCSVLNVDVTIAAASPLTTAIVVGT